MTKIQKTQHKSPICIISVLNMTQHNVGQIHSYQIVIGLSNVTMQREKKSCYHRKIQKRKQILQVQLHNYTIHIVKSLNLHHHCSCNNPIQGTAPTTLIWLCIEVHYLIICPTFTTLDIWGLTTDPFICPLYIPPSFLLAWPYLFFQSCIQIQTQVNSRR